MSKKLKNRLIRIIIVGILFIPLFIVDKVTEFSFIHVDENIDWLIPFLLYLSLYLIVGYDVLIKSVKNIAHGQVFDENFLMSIATIGAFIIREFPEAVAVMLLYQIGEFFQGFAVGKTRKSIANLMDIRPDFARLVKDDNQEEILDPELIEIGNIIRVEPGEKIPLDGVIIKGATSIDAKSLTGESMPVDLLEGDEVLSGTVNLTSTIDIQVDKDFSNSSVNKILELVENSSNVKSKHENFITVFAKWYTPLVVFSALLVGVLGSLITHDYLTWINRALNFLVVSCPCAIVISVPLAFFISLGKAAKMGILIKGSLYLENFNKVKTFVFDKTGTLTKGNFVISYIYPKDEEEEILRIASICESQSNHPIALAIKNNMVVNHDYRISNIPGKGVIAEKDGDILYAGNKKLFEQYGIKVDEVTPSGTIIYVGRNNKCFGYIVISDEIKEDARELLTYLNKDNIKTVMLTGDNEVTAHHVAEELQISSYHHSLLPQDKVLYFEKIMNENQRTLVSFVGDGVNDTPVLARSDIGISMGSIGSDAALEASDIVLMNDDLNKIAVTKRIAKKTIRIVKENIVFALLVKISILLLSLFGLASIWLAVFGDVGVALLCILNSLRCWKHK